MGECQATENRRPRSYADTPTRHTDHTNNSEMQNYRMANGNLTRLGLPRYLVLSTTLVVCTVVAGSTNAAVLSVPGTPGGRRCWREV